MEKENSTKKILNKEKIRETSRLKGAGEQKENNHICIIIHIKIIIRIY